MIAAKYLHKVPDSFSSFRVIAPGVVVDAFRTAEDSVGQPFGGFYSFGPDGPRAKPFLQMITHEEVADLVPLFHLLVGVLLPVVEPPSSFHVEICDGPPRLDHVQLQVHEDLDPQLAHALLRVGVLLPA